MKVTNDRPATARHTLAGPTPTNISRNSEPDIDRNGTPASPAVALANSVFPVPGGPDRIAPYTAEVDKEQMVNELTPINIFDPHYTIR